MTDFSCVIEFTNQGNAMQVALETPKAVNVTVKLASLDRDRLKRLANTRHRTPHFLMREAIQVYLEKAEAEQRFIDAAKQSLSQYQATGSHITLNEFSTWVKAVKSNPKAAMPLCHT
jgi:predicted transcriptional regulator